MKTITLHINVKAYDCYLYGDQIFFVMQDGTIYFAPYPSVISRLAKKYGLDFGLIKVAFLRNEYYYSKQATAFRKIPSVQICIQKEWKSLSARNDLILEWKDIEDLLTILCNYSSFPLTLSLYAMHLFLGCKDGLYDIDVQNIQKGSSERRIKRIFDARVIDINPKYGELVASLDNDGLLNSSIDNVINSTRGLSDNDVLDERSLRTGWTNTDMLNYFDQDRFTYYINEYETKKRDRMVRGEHNETKIITHFASGSKRRDDVLSDISEQSDEFSLIFNSNNNVFVQKYSGELVNVGLKIKKNNERVYSSQTYDSINRIEHPLSGHVIPKGFVLEYFDHVDLFRNGDHKVIEKGAAFSIRTYMNSIRYSDLLTITKEDSVAIHAIDTLDLDREPIRPDKTKRRNKNNSPLLEKNESDEDLPF